MILFIWPIAKKFLTFLCHGKIFTIFYLLEILNCKHQSRFFDDKKMNHIFVVELGDKNLLFCSNGWMEFREVDGMSWQDGQARIGIEEKSIAKT
jgi:hypothetical protein